MFRRRKRLSYLARGKEFVYPRGGFARSAKYLWHRLRRLPDPPHRVARGVFAGVLVNFPPIFGFQLIAAAGLAYLLRGNILAALLGTLLSNPITTPLIAVVSLTFGNWLLGTSEGYTLPGVFHAFADAGGDIWHNFKAIFTRDVTHWDGLILFWKRIYLPYLVGSILPGIITSLLMAWASVPLVRAYQAMRRRRVQKKRAAKGDDAAKQSP